MTGFITWDFNPEIFRTGFFSLRWYSTFFTIAFILGFLIMRKIFMQEGVTLKLLYRGVWYVAFGTLIGARLGHCLFYEPHYYYENPVEIFQTWKGGLASHGAGLGILTALYLFSRVERIPYIWILDRMTILVALAGSLIRMGNLTNSEIFGITTDLSWGFKFVRSPIWYQPPVSAQPCHPTQIYEGLAYLAIFVSLCLMYFKTNVRLYRGVLLGIFFVSVFTLRFLIEFIKLEQVEFEKGMTLKMGQLLSIPFILCGIYLLCFSSKKPDVGKNSANRPKMMSPI